MINDAYIKIRILPTPRRRLMEAMRLDQRIEQQLQKAGWTQVLRTAKKLSGTYTLVTAYSLHDEVRITIYVASNSRVHEIKTKIVGLHRLCNSTLRLRLLGLISQYGFDSEGNLKLRNRDNT